MKECLQEWMVSQQTKAEHKRPEGKLQSLPIPKWKWDYTTMNFFIELPKMQKGNDGLTKYAHFILMKVVDSVEVLAKLYVKEVLRLHTIKQ